MQYETKTHTLHAYLTTATINHVKSKLATVNTDSDNLYHIRTVSTQTVDHQRDSQAGLALFVITNLSVII